MTSFQDFRLLGNKVSCHATFLLPPPTFGILCNARSPRFNPFFSQCIKNVFILLEVKVACPPPYPALKSWPRVRKVLNFQSLTGAGNLISLISLCSTSKHSSCKGEWQEKNSATKQWRKWRAPWQSLYIYTTVLISWSGWNPDSPGFLYNQGIRES